jgi:hypothetical protein
MASNALVIEEDLDLGHATRVAYKLPDVNRVSPRFNSPPGWPASALSAFTTRDLRKWSQKLGRGKLCRMRFDPTRLRAFPAFHLGVVLPGNRSPASQSRRLPFGLKQRSQTTISGVPIVGPRSAACRGRPGPPPFTIFFPCTHSHLLRFPQLSPFPPATLRSGGSTVRSLRPTGSNWLRVGLDLASNWVRLPRPKRPSFLWQAQSS